MLSQTSSVKSLVRSFKSRVTASQTAASNLTSASQIMSLKQELEQEKLARLTLEKQL